MRIYERVADLFKILKSGRNQSKQSGRKKLIPINGATFILFKIESAL